MNKIVLNVPAEVRYISDWEDFDLPQKPCIINKQITGCGFTEWVIRNKKPSILVSPRKILLENKEDQHPDEVFYARNELEKITDVDKDLSSIKSKINNANDSLVSKQLDELRNTIDNLKQSVLNYYIKCCHDSKLCKILVTYDSFRYIKEALGKSIELFDIVVDEFQSIFTDSRFKSNTELEFLNHLQDLSRVYFVSATPMIDEYLEMLDEFRDLPYYELDWETEKPSRVIKPQLIIKSCKNIIKIANKVVQSYLFGEFEKYSFTDSLGNIQEIESRELVVYVNSVKNICDIITKNKLQYENTNVLCSNTPENQKKIRKAFGLSKGQEGGIGKVPKKGDPHKMFTLCTRTVYLGADFYSTCARSLILSDANIDCLAVDITLDLPQILGRQRLECNPWKNRAELYFKSLDKINNQSVEDFKEYVSSKLKNTEKLLSIYNKGDNTEKHVLAETYQKVAKSYNYKDDYVAVNTHAGSDLIPVINKLVMVSEIRAFQVQQVDYKDRFTVFKTIGSEFLENNLEIEDFICEFNLLTQFPAKMKFLVNNNFSKGVEDFILDQIPLVYKNYINVLGKDRIKALAYRKYSLEEEYNRVKINQNNTSNFLQILYSNFCIGNIYLKSDIKIILGDIYKESGISMSPKASDLEKYFELRPCKVTNKETGKRDHGFEILKKKENIN